VQALRASVLLYPVYALLFADAGLTTGEVSSLFAVWSVVSFGCEIPAGALAALSLPCRCPCRFCARRWPYR
jgi:hypothetical protein